MRSPPTGPHTNSIAGGWPWEDVQGKIRGVQGWKSLGSLIPQASLEAAVFKYLHQGHLGCQREAGPTFQASGLRPPPLFTVPASGPRGLGRDPGRGSKGTILKLLLMFINRVLPRMKLADHKTQFGKENTCVLSQGGEA